MTLRLTFVRLGDLKWFETVHHYISYVYLMEYWE